MPHAVVDSWNININIIRNERPERLEGGKGVTEHNPTAASRIIEGRRYNALPRSTTTLLPHSLRSFSPVLRS